MNQPTNFLAARLLSCLAVLSMVIAWACDTYDPDTTSQNQLSVGQTDYYVLANSSTVIDLNGLVKSDGEVDLLIGQQPLQGSLTKLEAGRYAYMPKVNLKTGWDYFMLYVLRDGHTVQRDTIRIQIGQDTTQLPCGVYAVADFVSIPNAAAGQQIVIDVLANDRICGADTSDLIVSIFTGPQHGAAVSRRSSIAYTMSGFTGNDSFLYSVKSVADTSFHTIGLVSLTLGDTCRLVARPDSVNVSSHSQGFGVNIFVLDNDSYCDSIPALSVVTEQHFGTVTVDQENGILFYKPDNNTYAPVDSLQYKICRSSGICSSAWVRITSF